MASKDKLMATYVMNYPQAGIFRINEKIHMSVGSVDKHINKYIKGIDTCLYFFVRDSYQPRCFPSSPHT